VLISSTYARRILYKKPGFFYENSFVAARAIWLLPYMGEKGNALLSVMFVGTSERVKLTAFRAIRRSGGAMDPLLYAKTAAKSSMPALRAEAAMEMRYREWNEAKDVLVSVARGWDGKDRSYLESLGLGAGHNTEKLWKALNDEMEPGDPVKWSDAFARLTWRLMPEAAVAALTERAGSSDVKGVARKLAVDSLAFINTRAAADALISLAVADSAVRDQATWWLKNRSEGEWSAMNLDPVLRDQGITNKPAELVSITVPAKPKEIKFTVAEVLKLKGDAVKGKQLATRCVMCHQIDGQGAEY
jgi:hypothetical protein